MVFLPEAALDNPIADTRAEVWRMSVDSARPSNSSPDKRNDRRLKQRGNKGAKARVE